MKDKRGYSLIELMGALVIIGLILLIVIPVVSRMLINNNNKEYNNYLKIIEAGAIRYADSIEDVLGTTSDKGCDKVSINDLIELNYIKKFNDKDTTCDGEVRIDNNKGKLTVSINLTCVNDGKEVFKQEKIDSSECKAFEFKEEDSLVSKIKNSGLSISNDNGKNYITDDDPNNYVWYSGKLWRVVYFNNEHVKLISNDIVTVMSRNDGDIKYDNSLVDNWLKVVFLPTLKDYNKYLIDSTWNDGTDNITRKVGLLSSDEFGKIGSFIDIGFRWLLLDYGEEVIKIVNSSGVASQRTYKNEDYYAIRPSITMHSDIFVISGNGTKELPYILKGNSTNIPSGTLINTRLSGEYLKINNVLYRIINVSNNLTKVIMVGTLPEQQYSEINTNFSYSKVYDYLKNDWYKNDLGSDKKLIYEDGSWCSRIVTGAFDYNEECSGDKFTSPVGLPSLGDIYTSNPNGIEDTFWTIDAYDDTYMNVIYQGSAKGKSLISNTAKIKPVMYLKRNVIIKSGNGTENNPFILDLK